MAKFALGSLATMFTRNPRVPVSGPIPYLGNTLNVTWQYLIPLCAAIAGMHAALLLVTVLVMRDVFIPEDSYLVIARILRDLVERVGLSGTLMEDGELRRAVQHRNGGGLVYGPLAVGGRGYVISVGEDVPRRAKLEGGRHPKGLYY